MKVELSLGSQMMIKERYIFTIDWLKVLDTEKLKLGWTFYE